MDENFSTPERMAQFFVRLGYHEHDYDGCLTELRETFPETDAVTAMHNAIEQDREEFEELDRVIAENDEAARRAELDTNKTMHTRKDA